MPDQVFINDLILQMSAGIYDHEKEKKQRVIINVILEVKSEQKPKTIRDVVSYEDITNDIIVISKEKHYELLEEFAEKIAQKCLENNKVSSAMIRAEKPDIIKDTRGVGIQITRKNA